MKVESISGSSVVPVSNLVRAWVSQGSIVLPVDSSQALYSNLKHIKGVPAPGKGEGYSLSKLQALDNLIERLQYLKGEDRIPDITLSSRANREPSVLKDQVTAFRKQLNETLSSRAAPFRGYAGLDTGLTLNLMV